MLSLIIGLGNDDPQYAQTYHNVGFIMIDWLAKQQITKILLQKTHGLMNTAGASVRKMTREQGITSEKLLIIHDDSDIELGNWKLSWNRGAAGHKGVQNVIDALGTQEFYRIRIGIRPKAQPGIMRKKAEEFVLKNISKTNQKTLERVFVEVVQKITTMIPLVEK